MHKNVKNASWKDFSNRFSNQRSNIKYTQKIEKRELEGIFFKKKYDRKMIILLIDIYR